MTSESEKNPNTQEEPQAVNAYVTKIPAKQIDAVRSTARSYGYNHTNCDVVRLAIRIANTILESSPDTTVKELLERLKSHPPLTNTTGSSTHRPDVKNTTTNPATADYQDTPLPFQFE